MSKAIHRRKELSELISPRGRRQRYMVASGGHSDQNRNELMAEGVQQGSPSVIYFLQQDHARLVMADLTVEKGKKMSSQEPLGPALICGDTAGHGEESLLQTADSLLVGLHPNL